MAIFYPSICDLVNVNFKRAKPSEEELAILQFFEQHLNDSYEIYFRPFFNGFRPSFVLLREKSGMAIIDYYDSFDDFNQSNDNHIIYPHKKFETQKFELLGLALPPEEIENNKRSLLGSVKGMAIINESQNEVSSRFSEVKYYQYFSFENFFNPEIFQYYLKKNYLLYDSIFYPDQSYKEIKRHLKPSLHMIDEGQAFTPNEKQKKPDCEPCWGPKSKGCGRNRQNDGIGSQGGKFKCTDRI